jgi:hypothetical protein
VLSFASMDPGISRVRVQSKTKISTQPNRGTGKPPLVPRRQDNLRRIADHDISPNFFLSFLFSFLPIGPTFLDDKNCCQIGGTC